MKHLPGENTAARRSYAPRSEPLRRFAELTKATFFCTEVKAEPDCSLVRLIGALAQWRTVYGIILKGETIQCGDMPRDLGYFAKGYLKALETKT